ncbi:carcinoembryonic antigen-related cell adhesion molecule 5-like [Polyodon spathula]|uniref:carcinoembryonic antigen-related cell adhesion molecule 5-like n=1 Tax=Polyodon spathula TaxID=7913 RepID=UPI001B7F3C37|nr:carcinoembryonic antigen-related cell adhesion molecule 5-like [Polyodon spathula]
MKNTRAPVLSLLLLALIKAPVSNGSPASEPLHLNSNYGPDTPIVTISPPNQVYFVGADVTMSCSAQSNPPAVYQWAFNGVYYNGSGSELAINLLQLDNTGNYTCRAYNNITHRYAVVTQELSVVAPITTVAVSPNQAQPIENKAFSLSCDVSGTADSMRWLKDGQPLSTNERITLSGENSTVSFNPVLQSDNGTYQCVASDLISVMVSLGYTLVVNYGPEQVSISGPDAYPVDSTASFTCAALSHPPCEYTWLFNGKEIAQGSVFTISPVMPASVGSYTCEAFNSVTGKKASSSGKEFQLTTNVSQPTVRSNVTNPVEFNDTVSLTCTAYGSAVSYRWFNGSSVLSDSERIHLSDDNKTLTIPRVLRSDDGTLYCYVFNVASNSTSEPFHLVVNYGPDAPVVIISPPNQVYFVGVDLTMSCSAQSYPPAIYQWAFNGFYFKELASALSITQLSMDNAGSFTCRAYNNITHRYAVVTQELSVVAPITTVAVSPNQAQPIENKTFSLSCDVSGTAYSMRWLKDGQPLSTNERITLSEENSTVSFNPVLQSDNGTYQCLASDPISAMISPGYKLIFNNPNGSASLASGHAVEVVIAVLVLLLCVSG